MSNITTWIFFDVEVCARWIPRFTRCISSLWCVPWQTTGGNSISGRIIQLAAVAVAHGGTELGTLSFCVDPEGVVISPFARNVHNLSLETIMASNPVSQAECATRA